MALRFADSFDHYVIGDILRKWTTQTSPAFSAGRYGGNAIGGSYNDTVTKTLDAQQTWIMGFAFRTDTLANAAIARLLDGTSAQMELRITSSGLLQVTRNGTQIGSNGATVLSINTWYYIEWKVKVHSSTGTVDVKINEINEINLTGQNTQATANATANVVALGGTTAVGAITRFDDFYCCDSTGSAPTNDFLGDVRVEALYPNGNGNSSQFDGSDGNQVDNYLLVDDATSDGDTTYVESPDVGDKDTYAFTNMSASTGTVYGVQLATYRRKTDAGSRTAVSVARLSGTETDGAAAAVFDSYAYAFDIREAKPGGGVWTVTDVNAAEFGIKVNS